MSSTTPPPLATSESGTVPRRGLLAVGLAVGLFALNAIWIREAGDHLWAFATWRMWLALPLLGALALTNRRRDTRAGRARRAPLGLPLVAAIVAVGVTFACGALVNFVAINETTLVNVGVITALQPAVITLVAGRWFGEAVDWRLASRAGLAMAGAVLVAAASSGSGAWSLHGDLLAVVALFVNAGWFLAGRWIRSRTHVDATSYMLVVFASAATALTVATVATGRTLGVPAEVLGFAALTALAGTSGHTLIAWAHRFVPASVSSLFLLSQPALVAALGWLVFAESLTWLQVGGAALVIGALAGIVARVGEAEPPPTAPGGLPDARDDVAAEHVADDRRERDRGPSG